MRAPDFWFTRPNAPSLRARLMSPFAMLTSWITARRVAKGPGYRAQVPVICVGNINVGGTGKTPTTIALAEMLTQNGHRPAIVTRGYGGVMTGPIRVDPAQHSAADVGDEALMMAAFAPVFKSIDRADGVRLAETDCDVILLDDGHQNPSVIKDVSLIVVNAMQGFGNGRVMPAGPLREPVATGLSRADAVLRIGAVQERDSFDALWPLSVPKLGAELRPLATGMPWAGLRVIAFAGIGHPERFFSTLRAVGADVVRAEPLDDHQPLSEALMTRLLEEAKTQNAQLVTTEKDAVRLPDALRAKVLPFPVRLDVTDWDPLRVVLTAKGIELTL